MSVISWNLGTNVYRNTYEGRALKELIITRKKCHTLNRDDGGSFTLKMAKQLIECGADVLVAGSSCI